MAIDKHFQVEVLASTPNPQQVIYAAMHQDYSEQFVWTEREKFPSEEKAGEIIVKNLLAGDRGHYGPLEHPEITLNCGWFPHSTMQQLRTHRTGISFDVQSFRYTSAHLIEVAEGKRDIEEVVYLRPVGMYIDRQGKKYEYTEEHRSWHRARAMKAVVDYADDLNTGLSEEHARGLIFFDVRQHWVVSVNVRSLMHLLDMRSPANAQLECQQLCELILPHFQAWVPAIAEWYIAKRWRKAKLAP